MKKLFVNVTNIKGKLKDGNDVKIILSKHVIKKWYKKKKFKEAFLRTGKRTMKADNSIIASKCSESMHGKSCFCLYGVVSLFFRFVN